MGREKSPCFTCVKRCLLCHAQCEEYSAWVQRQKDGRVKDKGYEADNFLRDQSNRRKRKYNSINKK